MRLVRRPTVRAPPATLGKGRTNRGSVARQHSHLLGVTTKRDRLPRFSRGPANAHADLRAGTECRPHRGPAAAATDEASEGAMCGRRAAMQLTFSVPRNGPRVSSSAKLAAFGLFAPCEHGLFFRKASPEYGVLH